jgi:hypothetical protein
MSSLVEPGGFATDWAGPSARHATPLPAYDEARKKAAQRRAQYAGSGPGDPTTSAAAVLRIASWEVWQGNAELAQG